MAKEADIPVADIGHGPIRTGLENPEDEDGGDEFAAWSNDHDHDRGARVPITLAGDRWCLRKRNGDVIVGQAQDKQTRAWAKLKTADVSARWQAYSLLANDSRDVRPDVLILVRERNTHGLPKLIRYGCAYLRIQERALPNRVLETASADALLILMHGHRRRLKQRMPLPHDQFELPPNLAAPPKDPPPFQRARVCIPTLREREGQFQLAHGEFGKLRNAAYSVFVRRYREAVELFAQVYDWVPIRHNNATGGFADSLWHPERPFKDAGRLTSTFGYNNMGKMCFVPNPLAARLAA